MRIALYHGRSFTSRVIRWICNSPVSHAAFVFDEGTEYAAKRLRPSCRLEHIKHVYCGEVVEAWEPGGVRVSRSISDAHAPGTQVDIYQLEAPLGLEAEKELLQFLDGEIGAPYDFRNVLRFLPLVRLFRSRGKAREKGWFCSELVFAGLQKAGRGLLRETAAEDVPPDWIRRSPLLRRVETHFVS